MPKIIEELVLTGCDSKTEWQLPWFLDNYLKHNRIPICVANFGVTEETRQWLATHPFIHCVMDLKETSDIKAWFYKPTAMFHLPAKKGVWLDTDCQVLDNIGKIFRLIEQDKLLMAVDKPWLKRRGELWHNSGVVGWTGRPEILQKWITAIKENPNVGDQEVLHSILNPITMMKYIKELPNEYNWLRLQIENDGEDSPSKKIVHWTGEKGNDRIRGMMKVMEALSA